MQDVFNAIAGAAAAGGGNYITDGRYLMAVEEVRFHQGSEGRCYIANLLVLESAPSEPGVAPNPAGSTVSMVCNIDKFKSAPGNAKAFALACLAPLGYTEAMLTPQALMETCGPGQPLRGIVVRNNTYRKPKRSNPSQILTLNGWQSVAQPLEDIKARRAELDQRSATTAAAQPAPQAAQQPAAAPQWPAPPQPAAAPQWPAPPQAAPVQWPSAPAPSTPPWPAQPSTAAPPAPTAPQAPVGSPSVLAALGLGK